jgi:hypothetical protein
MSQPRQHRSDTDQPDPTDTNENRPDHKTHGQGRPDEPDQHRTGEGSARDADEGANQANRGNVEPPPEPDEDASASEYHPD